MKRGMLALGCVLALAGGAAAAEPKKVSIKGSNTFGEELGPALIAEFRKSHPDVEIALESRGSGSGFAALFAGECDIASSSRSVNADERRLVAKRKLDLRNYTIGYYGVAVIVHADSPLKGLTARQVRSLFTGRTKNWKEIGGPDAPVNLYIRDPESGTHLGFRELAMADKPYDKDAKMFDHYAAIARAVAADPAGVGYVDMAVAKQDGIRVVSINKIRPSVETINDGTYPYARQLHLYTIRSRESKAAKAFIDYIRSRAGQRKLTELGYVRRFE
ncbi:MAG TPA: phosphate ABC transporter substrate-binding protein [Kiritimatiellia bacterium]|nr:phosphate ABC transporter substrate-binding protein [Kiritimatiellia bacterium]HRZ13537.1 phosphate ABC transporter substrate-binding protein [Kiritimatiellia bacterium]HSA19158.1 phosphate ABC transporter substrate-binding protein [Kiritimatiellia bacterium]